MDCSLVPRSLPLLPTPIYSPATADLSTRQPLPMQLPHPPPARPALPTLHHDPAAGSLLSTRPPPSGPYPMVGARPACGLSRQPPSTALSKSQGHCLLYLGAFPPEVRRSTGPGAVPSTQSPQERFAERWRKILLAPLLEPSPGGPGGSQTRRERGHIFVSFGNASHR